MPDSLALVLPATVVDNRLRESLIAADYRLGRSTRAVQQTTLCVPVTSNDIDGLS